MLDTGAARYWHKWPRCLPRRCDTQTYRQLGQHASGANGASHVRTYVGTCATQVAHTWRKLGQHASGAPMPQTSAARRWCKWGMSVPRRWRTPGANWGSAQVAHPCRSTGAERRWHQRQMAHACATQVAHTWRKLGQHARGAHVPQAGAARRWRQQRKPAHAWHKQGQHASGPNGPLVPRVGEGGGEERGRAVSRPH